MQKNASKVGEYYKKALLGLKAKYSNIGEVRGLGLFLGVELIDSERNPNEKLASHIKNELRDQGILISTDGPYNNVLKTKPPLCFNYQNVDVVVTAIEKVLKKE